MNQDQRYGSPGGGPGGGPGASEPDGQAHPGNPYAAPPAPPARPTVQDEARGAADDVSREARKATDTLASEARRLGSAARDQVEGAAEAQKDRLAERLSGVAREVGRSADGLRDQEAWLADLVDVGARELGGLADSLKSRDMGSIVSAVEQFGRRQPALFMGATVMLGFALGRAANAATGRGGESERSTPDTYGQHGHEAQSYRAPAPIGTPAGSAYPPASSGTAPAPSDGTLATGPDGISSKGRIG